MFCYSSFFVIFQESSPMIFSYSILPSLLCYHNVILTVFPCRSCRETQMYRLCGDNLNVLGITNSPSSVKSLTLSLLIYRTQTILSDELAVLLFINLSIQNFIIIVVLYFLNSVTSYKLYKRV